MSRNERLPEEQVNLIADLLRMRLSAREVSRRTGVSPHCVRKYRDLLGIPVYVVKAQDRKQYSTMGLPNICWDCARYCGDCPWSEYDAEKKCVKFGEIEGWTLEHYTANGIQHTRIAACPLFERG